MDVSNIIFKSVINNVKVKSNRPWAKNSSPNTSDLYIHYMDKSTGTPFFRRENGTSKLWQQRNECTQKRYFHLCCNRCEVYEMTVSHMYKSLVFDDEFLAHLKSHQRCSAAFCRPVKFFHTDWIIISLWFLSYTQRHCHVRIEKSPVQTVDIKLEAHNSLEYHYMLKHSDLFS